MKPKRLWFVVGELIFAVILSLFFFWLIDIGVLDRFLGDTYLEGFILIYAGISLTFFLGVFLVGIPAAVINGLRIQKAIVYSIIFWFISLILSVLLYSSLSVVSLYILLIGIIIGFNLGLGKQPVK